MTSQLPEKHPRWARRSWLFSRSAHVVRPKGAVVEPAARPVLTRLQPIPDHVGGLLLGENRRRPFGIRMLGEQCTDFLLAEIR